MELLFLSSCIFSENKRLEREADHLPVFSAKFKNVWSSTSTPVCALGVTVFVFVVFNCNYYVNGS
jgi:hypothetical protein